MIIDNIRNAQMYKSLSPGVRAALEFLEREDLGSLQPGRYDIMGDECYANVSSYTSKPETEGVWEAHRKYIDVQYILGGRERMGFSSIDNLKVCKEYDEEQDYMLLEGRGDFALVGEGMFTVFAPEDAHMPGIAVGSPGPVRKIVVKVRL